MFCPFCESEQVFVKDSRPTKSNSQVWRRRRCQKCGELFTTYEKIDLSYLIIVKKSGRKERYSRPKLFSGIYHSAIDTKNGDRGDISELCERVTNKVEQDILELRQKEIKSTEILEIVLNNLKETSMEILLRYLAYREGENEKRLKELL